MTVTAATSITAAIDIDLNDAVTTGASVAAANGFYVDDVGEIYVDDAGNRYDDGIYYATADLDLTFFSSITSAS